jgi:hypothetical protein
LVLKDKLLSFASATAIVPLTSQVRCESRQKTARSLAKGVANLAQLSIPDSNPDTIIFIFSSISPFKALAQVLWKRFDGVLGYFCESLRELKVLLHRITTLLEHSRPQLDWSLIMAEEVKIWTLLPL